MDFKDVNSIIDGSKFVYNKDTHEFKIKETSFRVVKVFNRAFHPDRYEIMQGLGALRTQEQKNQFCETFTITSN